MLGAVEAQVATVALGHSRCNHYQTRRKHTLRLALRRRNRHPTRTGSCHRTLAEKVEKAPVWDLAALVEVEMVREVAVEMGEAVMAAVVAEGAMAGEGVVVMAVAKGLAVTAGTSG